MKNKIQMERRHKSPILAAKAGNQNKKTSQFLHTLNKLEILLYKRFLLFNFKFLIVYHAKYGSF